MAGLAGFVLSARLSSAEAVAGEGYELRVIASVLIGGTSLFGGLGRIASNAPPGSTFKDVEGNFVLSSPQ